MGRVPATFSGLLVVLGVLSIIAIYIPIVITLIFIMVILMLMAFLGALVFWALGNKIDIKVDEKTIGYIRWFKFYPTESPLSVEETKKLLGASESISVNSTAEGMQLWLERKNKK